ncbi:MAG: hypothetical protein WDZ76_04830 [Pseudohongiellaceae bacterium]
MKTLEYTLRFITPAFLGNAEQNGQWRTPPFKALLRQWWRVAYAAEQGFRMDTAAIAEMRKKEGMLFGHAWLEGDRDDKGSKVAARKSLVRIRLDDWSLGKLNQAPVIGAVAMGKNQIPGALYSGYGPVVPGPMKAGPKLKANAAIQSEEKALFRIAFPEGAGIEEAITLINAYGALGGRSRNGWGSFELKGDIPAPKDFARDWKEAMQLDWPHALGKDENGDLVWESSPQSKWEDAMKLLAQARADMRRAVPDRLMLAYPDTRDTMKGWGKNDRVPNSLRFKVRSGGKQFIALIFHMPCRPGAELWQKLSTQKQQGFVACFSAAHAFLDKHQQFHRVGV